MVKTGDPITEEQRTEARRIAAYLRNIAGRLEQAAGDAGATTWGGNPDFVATAFAVVSEHLVALGIDYRERLDP